MLPQVSHCPYIHLFAALGINEFGTEEQKQKYLRPPVGRFQDRCFGLTEPGAGTDAAGVRTEATLDGRLLCTERYKDVHKQTPVLLISSSYSL